MCVWLQSLMECAVTLGIGAGQEKASPALSSLLAQYASLLAAQVWKPFLPISIISTVHEQARGHSHHSLKHLRIYS